MASAPPLAVVAGCGGCLLLSLLTLLLLLLRCRLRPRALFLKLQCCAATVAAMAVFLHAVHRPPPPVCIRDFPGILTKQHKSRRCRIDLRCFVRIMEIFMSTALNSYGLFCT